MLLRLVVVDVRSAKQRIFRIPDEVLNNGIEALCSLRNFLYANDLVSLVLFRRPPRELKLIVPETFPYKQFVLYLRAPPEEFQLYSGKEFLVG